MEDRVIQQGYHRPKYRFSVVRAANLWHVIDRTKLQDNVVDRCESRDVARRRARQLNHQNNHQQAAE